MKLGFFALIALVAQTGFAATPDLFQGSYNLTWASIAYHCQSQIQVTSVNDTLTVSNGTAELYAFKNINGTPYPGTNGSLASSVQVTFNGTDTLLMVQSFSFGGPTYVRLLKTENGLELDYDAENGILANSYSCLYVSY